MGSGLADVIVTYRIGPWESDCHRGPAARRLGVYRARTGWASLLTEEGLPPKYVADDLASCDETENRNVVSGVEIVKARLV